MKTTVVPAQITTVEDKIAGNLNLTQIVLLVFGLIIGAAIYAGFPPKMHFGDIKVILIVIICLCFGVLSLRFNGKIVADWLIVYLRFKARPRKYIFTKNDLSHRDIIRKEGAVLMPKRQSVELKTEQRASVPLREQIKIDQLFDKNLISLSFKPSKKGGLDVQFEKAKN